MARVSWFDEKTDLPVIHEQAEKLESFTQAMADGRIDREEIDKQQASLVAVMRDVESVLTDEQHDKVTRLLIEVSAYNVMRLLHELQSERLQRALSRPA
jgi:hypothetical protein